MNLSAGIIDGEEYEQLLRDPVFIEVEKFSNKFLASNGSFLSPYRRRWVADPLHQWSRQWEYPFALSRIESYAGAHEGPLQVLDAGSGMTFFPYLLASRFGAITVTCCDFDPGLAAIYEAVNQEVEAPVYFRPGDLHRLEFPENSFDLIYCVSVIEHLADFEGVLDEFSRVLKPGGGLVLTFDIALDGVNEIPPVGAQRLLDAARQRFAPEAQLPRAPITTLLEAPNLLSTRRVRQTGAGVLPWSLFSPKRLKPLRHFRLPGIPNLTVFCGSFENRKGR